jgi:membrane protein DedA with SNARE-associated domain
MKNIGRLLNLAAGAICLTAGYLLAANASQPYSNEDWLACPLLFILACLFVFLCAWRSLYFAKCKTLPRPSLNRFSLSWRDDPLQCLAGSTVNITAIAIGVAIRSAILVHPQFLFASMFFSGALGACLGQVIVYKIYRDRISASQTE